MSAERLLVPQLFTPGAPEHHSDPKAEMETLRTVVNQRMAAAVEDILEVFVKTVVRYRDQIDHQQRQLDSLRAAEGQWSRAADPLQAAPWIKPCPDDLNVQPDHRDSLDHHNVLKRIACLDHSGNLVHPNSLDPPETLDHPESLDQPEGLDQIHATSSAAHIKTEAGSLSCGEPTVQLVSISDGASDDRLLADCSETDDSGDYWREGAGLWKPEETKEHQGTSLCSKEKNFSVMAPQVRPVFTCKVCGESFQRISYLFTHSSAHLMDCGLCGRHLEHSETLKLHLKVHRKASFRCGVCGQSFTLRGNLRTHMRIHSGERPFSCTICGKSFGRRATLVRHVRSHTGEKPFTCTYCGRGFVEKGNLTVHLRTHTGERPYWCSNCDRRFSQLSCFYKHPCQRSHLNIEDPNT